MQYSSSILFCFLSEHFHLWENLIYDISARLTASCVSVFPITVSSWHVEHTQYILGERSKQLNKWVWSLGGRLQLLSSDSHLDSTFLGQARVLRVQVPTWLLELPKHPSSVVGMTGLTSHPWRPTQMHLLSFQFDFIISPAELCTYYMFWIRKTGDLADRVKDETISWHLKDLKFEFFFTSHLHIIHKLLCQWTQELLQNPATQKVNIRRISIRNARMYKYSESRPYILSWITYVILLTIQWNFTPQAFSQSELCSFRALWYLIWLALSLNTKQLVLKAEFNTQQPDWRGDCCLLCMGYLYSMINLGLKFNVTFHK